MAEFPPAGGWQRPEAADAVDADALARLLARLAAVVPPETWAHLVAAAHELLLSLRGLIDWYLERDARQAQPVAVRGIPIL